MSQLKATYNITFVDDNSSQVYFKFSYLDSWSVSAIMEFTISSFNDLIDAIENSKFICLNDDYVIRKYIDELNKNSNTDCCIQGKNGIDGVDGSYMLRNSIGELTGFFKRRNSTIPYGDFSIRYDGSKLSFRRDIISDSFGLGYDESSISVNFRNKNLIIEDLKKIANDIQREILKLKSKPREEWNKLI